MLKFVFYAQIHVRLIGMFNHSKSRRNNVSVKVFRETNLEINYDIGS